jgi:hypothetical protein
VTLHLYGSTHIRYAESVLTAVQNPTGNRLPAALPEAEWLRWLRQLEPAEMPLAKVLYESGDNLTHVYFPYPSPANAAWMRQSLPVESGPLRLPGRSGCCVLLRSTPRARRDPSP